LVYGVQLIYFCIFRTPLSLFSIGGAKDAMQFWDIAVETIFKNIVAIILLFVPLFILIMHGKLLVFGKRKPIEMGYVLLFGVVSFSFTVICITFTGDSPVSQYTLYFKENSPELSMNKLGVMTTMRLDFERLVLGELTGIRAGGLTGKADADGANGDGNPGDPASNPELAEWNGAGQAVGNGLADGLGGGGGKENPGKTGTSGEPGEAAVTMKPYNVMDVDFEALLTRGEKDTLYSLHKYFSTVKPTATNGYTGMFKGCNLVMVTAEGFSPYVISPELTPTLYMMANEGFVFKNFYNPVWWVSTSDGEYVACTGLIPKSGVWSFYKSGNNYMPFAMGNQFRKLGYITKAYHNHTYTYYRRDVSHPNMGYDYKGVGNGLNVKKTWPESDLEMIDVTAGEYIGDKPFHAYYMTVSGHMNYNFGGNQMARKNRDLVEHLPYSDTSKAYIACNLELEFAMKSLMDKLEAAGVAENTVIVISSDHYPYGLDRKYINELAGHEVEGNFELYKSTLILYKKGMEPVIIDKPCASLDIIPTLSNLFGLEYDSRLLMGTDILSDTSPLVIFSNRSWITDRAMYNSSSNTVTFLDGTDKDKEYVKLVNRVVADKFKYSAKILETDYYGKILKGKQR
jgi:lipoteichoic acid synthase